MNAPVATPLRVVIAGDELAFPVGGASTVYVRRMARAMARAGARVTVLCLDYSERETPPRNTLAAGDDAGVSFAYLTGDPSLPRGPAAIVGGRARALAALGPALDVAREPGRTVAVYYGRFPSVLLRLHAQCAARGIPLVASVVEWRLAFADQTASQRVGDAVFHRWLARLDGAMVISHWLEDTLRARTHAGFPLLRVPLLVDPDETSHLAPAPTTRPYALLCADFDSYPDDARFAVSVIAQTPALDLMLVGKAQAQRAAILAHAASLGCADRVRLEDQYLPDEVLRARYRGASALLAPLHDDARSRARFPSKLADYLMAERPVVSCEVGEVGRYLRDGETAFLCAPDDRGAFADALVRATTSADRERVAAQGRALALREFALDVQGPRMVAWLDAIARGAAVTR